MKFFSISWWAVLFSSQHNIGLSDILSPHLDHGPDYSIGFVDPVLQAYLEDGGIPQYALTVSRSFSLSLWKHIAKGVHINWACLDLHM